MNEADFSPIEGIYSIFLELINLRGNRDICIVNALLFNCDKFQTHSEIFTCPIFDVKYCGKKTECYQSIISGRLRVHSLNVIYE